MDCLVFLCFWQASIIAPLGVEIKSELAAHAGLMQAEDTIEKSDFGFFRYSVFGNKGRLKALFRCF